MTQEATTQTKTIEINEAFRLFDLSFNRVKYFTIIAQSTPKDISPETWSFKKDNGFIYHVKAPENPEQTEMIVDGYKHFIQRYLVRDVCESFALCLDKLFFFLTIQGKRIQMDKNWLENLGEQSVKELKQFNNVGLSEKIERLRKLRQVEVKEETKLVVNSLKDIRDCLSHGNGIVRPNDGEAVSKSSRRFSWKTMSGYALGENTGTRYDLKPGMVFSEPGSIVLAIETHKKVFSIGEALDFTPIETYEIAFTLQQISRELIEKSYEMVQKIKT